MFARAQAGLLVVAFGMIAWLQMAALTRDLSSEKRGIKDLVLSTVAVTGGSVGLLLLLATSTQDLSWASAVVPVRLLIVLIVAWFTVGFLVIPPLFSTCHEIAESYLNPRGRTRVRTLTEEATMKLIAVQTKQLSWDNKVRNIRSNKSTLPICSSLYRGSHSAGLATGPLPSPH